jgi:predicted NBD/HSP70 family sugar kinase
VTDTLVRATHAALGTRRARVAAVSAADPVDKATGELVHLPDAPFLVGALSPGAVLAPVVDGAVVVDNDVNWAARAEHAVRAPDDAADDFVYLYLGEGIGCAVITDGQVRRGHHGLAGEIAHVPVAGPDGRALPLIAAFGRLGLHHPDSTAVDVDRLLNTLASADGAALARTLAGAIAGALDGAIAFADPAFVVLAGPWAAAEAFTAELDDVLAQRPRRIAISQPRVRKNAPLEGARAAAMSQLRSDLIARSR